ncbi:MAG: MBL fold metallo-hydrolase [Gemmatimonas sp.]|nr:MBL fold metallo-hydrolase [Gemmatimonas sp.]
MDAYRAGTALFLVAVAVSGAVNASAQTVAERVEQHVAAARQAAGEQHLALFNRICPSLAEPPEIIDDSPVGLPATPGRELWYTEPVQVFDNLYYVGQTEYSAWALETSEGIIVIDAIFDYSVEAEIAEGLRTLGLDPNDIEYVIISHGHGDHVGGAAFLQQEFGARVVMAEADWDLVEASTADWPKPRRDIVATDGQQIRLGDTSVTVYLTPGHTPGTISTVLPLRDGDRTHVAAYWGGTAFNFQGSEEFPRDYWLRAYRDSAERFRAIARAAYADVLLSNHPSFDGTPAKVAALAEHEPDDPHPYVIGNDIVSSYLTVAQECAEATLLSED